MINPFYKWTATALGWSVIYTRYFLGFVLDENWRKYE